MSIAGHSSEASALANASEALLQDFLVKLDGMIECASKAVEVCAADAIWMSNLLHAMVVFVQCISFLILCAALCHYSFLYV